MLGLQPPTLERDYCKQPWAARLNIFGYMHVYSVVDDVTAKEIIKFLRLHYHLPFCLFTLCTVHAILYAPIGKQNAFVWHTLEELFTRAKNYQACWIFGVDGTRGENRKEFQRTPEESAYAKRHEWRSAQLIAPVCARLYREYRRFKFFIRDDLLSPRCTEER